MMLKITPQLAALIMRKDGQFVRIGLQRGLLPFGEAFRCKDTNKRYSYYISPGKFMDYTGATEAEIRKTAEKFGLPV